MLTFAAITFVCICVQSWNSAQNITMNWQSYPQQMCLCLPQNKQIHVTQILSELQNQNKDIYMLHEQVNKMAYRVRLFFLSDGTIFLSMEHA